jgi:hypothetical protein
MGEPTTTLPFYNEHPAVTDVHDNLKWLAGKFSLSDIAVVLNGAYITGWMEARPAITEAQVREAVAKGAGVASNDVDALTAAVIDDITAAVMALVEGAGNEQ